MSSPECTCSSPFVTVQVEPDWFIRTSYPVVSPLQGYIPLEPAPPAPPGAAPLPALGAPPSEELPAFEPPLLEPAVVTPALPPLALGGFPPKPDELPPNPVAPPLAGPP